MAFRDPSLKPPSIPQQPVYFAGAAGGGSEHGPKNAGTKPPQEGAEAARPLKPSHGTPDSAPEEGDEPSPWDAENALSDLPEQPQPLDPERVEADMATATYAPAMQGTPDRSWETHGLSPANASWSSALPGDDSDATVMLRVSAGDDGAFTFLLEKYRKPIIHFMYRMTSNQAVAEELAQEVFLRVYRSRESYRAEAKFTTWLYRIATNLGVNYARDHKHERAAQNVYLDQPDAETGTTPDVADARATAEQSLLRDERLRGIRSHIQALPDRQRQAVIMHKYQEMDYREIGAVLKLSESATKSLLFRAYQTLRERLKDYV